MRTSTLGDDLTHDDFLGGKISIWQPRNGYRAGVDAVLLAAAVEARSGETVLDLGCGVGTAALCLAARVPGVRLTGVELQPEYAALAIKNGLSEVVEADLRALPSDLRQRQFHHVIMNPPYFDRAQGHPAADAGRDIGRGGDTALADWLDVGIKRLRPRGYLTLIQHIDRLPDVLAFASGRLGSLILRPIVPRAQANATLFLLQGRQDGRAPFQLIRPLIMHEGIAHEADKESYTPDVRMILRDAGALSIRG